MISLDSGNQTIISLLARAAEVFKDDKYASRRTDNGWESFTYSDVQKRVNQLASYLLDLGFEEKSNFAILSEGSPMWLMSEYAVLSIRGISVPLSVKLQPEELPYRLNHAEVKGVFVSKNHLKKVISVLNKVENDQVKLIYLDEDQDHFYHLLAEAGIDKSRGVCFWNAFKKGAQHSAKWGDDLKIIKSKIKEDDVVNISYTSGTTGNPKGIMLTHLNYYTNANDGLTMFRLKRNFRTLVILPVDHSFAHTVALYGSLFVGLDLYFNDARGGVNNAIKNIPICLAEVKPQFLLTVPALSGNFMNKMHEGVKEKGAGIYNLFLKGIQAGTAIHGDGFKKVSAFTKLINYPVYAIAKSLIFSKLGAVFGGELQFMVGGGALLDLKQQQFFNAIGTPILQGYGLTEAAPIISANTPFKHKFGSSGSIMPSITPTIMRNEQEKADFYEIGEIVIQGKNVMKGYYKMPEESAKALRNNWLWSGDLGFMDEDGFLNVTGRNKALLISEDAEKYSPEGIEEAIVNCSEYFTHVMAHCDHNRFTTAVVSIDPIKMSALKRMGGEAAYEVIKKDFMAFMSDPTYKAIFQRKWIPKHFFIAPEPFNEENKMVNSTLKMVRYKITEAYNAQIDGMYAPKGIAATDALNIQTLS